MEHNPCAPAQEPGVGHRAWLLEQYRVFRWKVRPANSWEVYLGGHRERGFSLSLSPVSHLSWAVWPLLFASLCLCSVFLSVARIPLLTHGFSALRTPSSSLFAAGPTLAMTLHNPKGPSLSNLVQILERENLIGHWLAN